ncbi:MAG: hypothetical protein ABR512_04045 [Desulfopila sp.]
MIDFEKYRQMTMSFLSSYPIVTIGLIMVAIFFLYKKPAQMIKFLGFCGLLIAVLYIMSLLTESGSQGVLHKKEATTKSQLELMNE